MLASRCCLSGGGTTLTKLLGVSTFRDDDGVGRPLLLGTGGIGDGCVQPVFRGGTTTGL